MSIKNIALVSLMSTAFISNGLAWRGYDLDGHYNSNEGIHKNHIPFPLIFHYKKGGKDSTASNFRITDRVLTLQNVPEAIQAELRGVDNIEVYEAFCLLEEQNCNYFTHVWSMDRMIENRLTYISSGVYNAKNLEAIAGQIGINSLVEQGMSFHDAVYLSDNSARFKITDMNQVAEGWFVSYYDPVKNANCGNVAINQKKKAIVVHWYFLPQNLADSNQKLSEPYKSFNAEFWGDSITNTLIPQFVPACSIRVQESNPVVTQATVQTTPQNVDTQVIVPAVQAQPKKSMFKKLGKVQTQQVAPVTQAPTVQSNPPVVSQSAPKKSMFKKLGKK